MDVEVISKSKHVFYTHSHITSLCIKETIKTFKIPKDRIIIVCLENHYEVIDKSWFPDIEIFIYRRSRWKKPWFRGKIGLFLKEWALFFFTLNLTKRENYILYIPHDHRDESKNLIFNKNCIGYYYIEEGLGSYIPKLFGSFEVPNVSLLSCVRPLASRYSNANIYNLYPKLLGGICFNSAAFPPITNKIILTEFSNYHNTENSKDFNAPYLFFDDMVNMRMCKLETLLKVLALYIVESGIKVLNVKFHYRQGTSERLIITEAFKKNNVIINVVEDRRVVELLFLKNNIQAIGFISSLIFYNKVFGIGKSVSLMKEILCKEGNISIDKYEYMFGLFEENKIEFFISQNK